ncbi:MAG: S1C family serine protease [Luteolibacter sp.]
MVSHNRPARPVGSSSIRRILGIVLLSQATVLGQISPLEVEFLPTASRACAVPAPNGKYIVTLFVDSHQLSKANWLTNGSRRDLKFLGQDKITRLCFFLNPVPQTSAQISWAKQASLQPSQSLKAITLDAALNCRFEHRVSQIQEKVLPLSLLLIKFDNSPVPRAGTPLLNEKEEIVGLIIQPASGNTAYAIPAEAIHRVQNDIITHRKLVKGWLGISLSTGSRVPRITRVMPGSPAAKAGIKEQDVLLKAGSYSTNRYPDAVNALFYTIPGQPTSLVVQRNGEEISHKVIPVVSQPGN